jgi:hypothetical protein
LTLPVLTSLGTVVLISDFDMTSNVAGVPSKVTLLAPVRLVPRMITGAPAFPEVGQASTNGPSPRSKLKTVPSSSVPPK